MLGLTYKSDDPNITKNDGDSSWGSMMCIEIDPVGSGCGYAANYGQPLCIDYHLYQTIPATDCRKKCYVDFAIDDMSSRAEKLEALSAYTAHPDWLLDGTGTAAHSNGYAYTVGGLPLKFRVAGGEAGRANQYIGWVVAVPMMRVEEMYLIEAEAAAHQDAGRGVELLKNFVTTYRDPGYICKASSVEDAVEAVFLQKRIELWGEGQTFFDYKRLNHSVDRTTSTNWAATENLKTEGRPAWMTFPIIISEENNNQGIKGKNNPDPSDKYKPVEE
jgi:hypothetical protein